MGDMTSAPDIHLREAGLRVTAGRVALLNAINEQPHSDAETLCRLVQGKVPTISVQSVHNVLHDLTEVGLLRRIEPAGSPARYERRLGDNHHHVVCTTCGTIADVDCVHGEAPCLTPSDTSGFTVHTAEITFWGLCPACANAATASSAVARSAITSSAVARSAIADTGAATSTPPALASF
ncbi:MAG: Fur family transcriptional regulator [Glaciihabitans sp.]|nr:Fur family transcriptional regulator [Glaciihabitans sp.]